MIEENKFNIYKEIRAGVGAKTSKSYNYINVVIAK